MLSPVSQKGPDIFKYFQQPQRSLQAILQTNPDKFYEPPRLLDSLLSPHFMPPQKSVVPDGAEEMVPVDEATFKVAFKLVFESCPWATAQQVYAALQKTNPKFEELKAIEELNSERDAKLEDLRLRSSSPCYQKADAAESKNDTHDVHGNQEKNNSVDNLARGTKLASPALVNGVSRTKITPGKPAEPAAFRPRRPRKVRGLEGQFTEAANSPAKPIVINDEGNESAEGSQKRSYPKTPSHDRHSPLRPLVSSLSPQLSSSPLPSPSPQELVKGVKPKVSIEVPQSPSPAPPIIIPSMSSAQISVKPRTSTATKNSTAHIMDSQSDSELSETPANIRSSEHPVQSVTKNAFEEMMGTRHIPVASPISSAGNRRILRANRKSSGYAESPDSPRRKRTATAKEGNKPKKKVKKSPSPKSIVIKDDSEESEGAESEYFSVLNSQNSAT